jgi:hypothetical protein
MYPVLEQLDLILGPWRIWWWGHGAIAHPRDDVLCPHFHLVIAGKVQLVMLHVVDVDLPEEWPDVVCKAGHVISSIDLLDDPL